jgi:hypothetical protein
MRGQRTSLVATSVLIPASSTQEVPIGVAIRFLTRRTWRLRVLTQGAVPFAGADAGLGDL